MHNALIIGIGEILWDMLPQGQQLGGAPANFAYHVSKLGMQGAVVSAIGNDALGDGINIIDPDLVRQVVKIVVAGHFQ